MALVPLRNVLQRAHFRPGLQGLFAALSFPLPTCLCVSVCARSAFLTYKDKPFFRLSFSPAFPCVCVCVLYFWAGDVNLAGDCRTVIKGKARQWVDKGESIASIVLQLISCSNWQHACPPACLPCRLVFRSFPFTVCAGLCCSFISLWPVCDHYAWWARIGQYVNAVCNAIKIIKRTIPYHPCFRWLVSLHPNSLSIFMFVSRGILKQKILTVAMVI